MGDIVTVERKIFGKNTFVNVVDTSFSQLVPVEDKNIGPKPATIESFFDDYETLFYDIPASGSIQSHQEIVLKSSDYLGISLLEMEEEIRSLREENVALKRQLFVLTNTGNI
jgi:hypothetical protein